MGLQNFSAQKRLAHIDRTLHFSPGYYDTQEELDDLRQELTFAQRRIKRLKWGLAIFAAYFVFITLTYLLRTNIL